MYKDLALSNLQLLMCHKTRPNSTIVADDPTFIYDLYNYNTGI